MPEALTRWAPPPMFQPLPPNVPMSAPLMGRFVMNNDVPQPPESAPLLHQPMLLGPPPMGLPAMTAPVFLHPPPPTMTPVPTGPMLARPPGPWVSSSPPVGTSTATSPSSFMSPAAPALPSTPQKSQVGIKRDDSLGPFTLDEDVKPIRTTASPWLPPPPMPWL